MQIRNHGIDTVKITFSNKGVQKNSYNYLSFQTLQSLHIRLLSLRKNKADNWILIPNSSTYIDKGFIDTFLFTSSNTFSSLYISLPKFKYGTNVHGLNMNDIKDTINDLSDLLEIDAGKGKLNRIDYCYNFHSELPWDKIVHNIECTNKKFDTLLYNNSTYYIQNKSREICFYSQVHGRYSPKKHKIELQQLEKIKQQVHSDNLFRVELKLLTDALKPIQCMNAQSKGLLFKDLLLYDNRVLLFKKYESLIRIPKFLDTHKRNDTSEFDLSLHNRATVGDHYLHMLAFNIHQRGIKAVTNEVYRDKFSTKHHKDSVDERIEAANLLLSKNIKSDDTQELPSQIKTNILNEIKLEYPKKPNALF